MNSKRREELEKQIIKTYHPDYRASEGRRGFLDNRDGATVITYLDRMNDRQIAQLHRVRMGARR